MFGRARVRESTRFAIPPACRHIMIQSLDNMLLRANRWAIIAILAAMALMVFANVALRYLTDQSILWAEEASRYAMIWLTFIGSGLVLRHGGHIGIDMLQERLPRHAPAIRGVVFLLMLVFFVLMVWIGARYAMLTWAQTTPVLGIPMGVVYLAMPIGFALMTVHLLLMALPYIRDKSVLGGGEFDADMVKM
jgi:TRAP-type C4-dicarboxylate transport system permease small subunit